MKTLQTTILTAFGLLLFTGLYAQEQSADYICILPQPEVTWISQTPTGVNESGIHLKACIKSNQHQPQSITLKVNKQPYQDTSVTNFKITENDVVKEECNYVWEQIVELPNVGENELELSVNLCPSNVKRPTVGTAKIKVNRKIALEWDSPDTFSLGKKQELKAIIKAIQPISNIEFLLDGKLIPDESTRNFVLTSTEKGKIHSHPWRDSLIFNKIGHYKITLKVWLQGESAPWLFDNIIQVVEERRIALVIGNDSYQYISTLDEIPLNDARDMANSLRDLGFEVFEQTNLDQKNLDKQFKQFVEKILHYDVALVYFAGHGVQLKGKDYFIPVDLKPTPESVAALKDIEILKSEMIAKAPYNKTFIFIGDFCRDNGGLPETAPYADSSNEADSSSRSISSNKGSNSSSKKDDWVAPTSFPSGAFICYATSSGKVARNAGTNGLYTGFLLKHIKTPCITIEDMMKRVRVEALQKGQKTVDVTELITKFSFSPCD